ncbi:hypothetical protein D3C85_14470 [compost metagenome]
MRRITARSFMNRDIVAEWPLPDEKLEVEFDDGVLETNTRRMILSWFCWELHRKFPLTPLNKSHYVGNGFPSADMVPKTISNIIYDLHYTYFSDYHPDIRDHDAVYDRENAWRVVKDVGNEIYNVLSINLEEWQVSINAFHLDELFWHPPIAAIRDKIEETQISISHSLDATAEILMKDPALLHNPIIRGLRSKQIKMGQFLQIVMCLGFRDDLDQTIFRKPVTVGFYEGLTTLHDIMIESCSAKKALMFTKKPLQIVEYFNRKMQLSTVVVDKLIWDDCGSDKYSEIYVDSVILPHLEGKLYQGPNGKLVPVRHDDYKLVGKSIHMRSAFNCRYRGDGSVCRVCFGELAWSIPRFTSLGHTCATELCREGSQRTLSVKHLDGSSMVEVIEIPDEYLPYIGVCAANTDTESDEERAVREMWERNVDSDLLGEDIPTNANESSLIKFNSRIHKMKPILVLKSTSDKNIENATNLVNISKDTNIKNLNIHRFTAFREVLLKIVNLRDEATEIYVPVSQGSRLGSLTRLMLDYIQQNGYTIDENGDFSIDLSNWDFSSPAFSLPRRHASTLDFMAEVEAFIRSPSKKSERNGFAGRMLTSYTDPVTALVEFSDLVNSKLRVNVAHLEVILLSLMRPADDPDDYNLPPYDRPIKFEEHRRLIQERSAGQIFAYERQPDYIEDVGAYSPHKRTPGLLDPFLFPEVINVGM